MRHRDIITKRLESLENQIIGLENIVKTSSPISEYIKKIETTKILISEIKGYVEAEPLSGYELNK